MDSNNFATSVWVGTTHQALTSTELLGQMQACPVANNDLEFNCQLWVGEALNRMQRAGYFTEEEVDIAEDSMVEATLEATGQRTS